MNEIDNRLYNYYNNEFNRAYDKNAQLNREILTKNQMIMFNNSDAVSKDILIDFLLYFFYICLFSFFGLLFYVVNFVSWRSYLYFVLAIICLYTYIFITRYYWNNFQKGVRRAEEETANTVRTVLQDIIGVLFPSYINKTTKCPKKCRGKDQDPDLPIDDENSLNQIPFTKLDDDYPVWRYGEPYAKDGGYDWIKPDPNAIKYKCKLIPGNSSENNLKEFSSYIPCRYYLNYEQSN